MAAPLTQDDLDRFLEALAETANVTRSCEIAGFTKPTAYNHRDSNPEFAAAWLRAVERGTDSLEDEATRRAKEGVEEPVYQGGALVGTRRAYSDTLLMFMLKARRPARFRDTAPPPVMPAEFIPDPEPMPDEPAPSRPIG